MCIDLTISDYFPQVCCGGHKKFHMSTLHFVAKFEERNEAYLIVDICLYLYHLDKMVLLLINFVLDCYFVHHT